MSGHLITTKAKGGACVRCRRPVLTGLAEGLAVTVDLIPLTPADELAVLLAGCRTYSFTIGELIYRDRFRIAGNIRGHILAEHRCPAKSTQESLFDFGGAQWPIQ